jgi:hypothetical protein
MGERENRPDLIKEYLDRLKVQDKSATVEEYSHRLTHLSAVRSILAELARKGFAVAEGPSFIDAAGEIPNVRSLAPPDYVVLREDVLLYMYLSVDEKREISTDFAKGIWEALRDNSSLSAVVVAWPGPEYPSICIDSFTVRNYLERKGPIDLSVEDASPLITTIERFYSAQFVDWDIPFGLGSTVQTNRVRGVTDQLFQNLVNAFEAEKARALGVPEKIEAQKRVSPEDVARLRDKLSEILLHEKLTRSDFQELREYIQSMVKD